MQGTRPRWLQAVLIAALAILPALQAHAQSILVRGTLDAVKVTQGAEKLAKALETIQVGATGNAEALTLLKRQHADLLDSPEVKELMTAASEGQLNPSHPIFKQNPSLRFLLVNGERELSLTRPCGGGTGKLCELADQIELAALAATQAAPSASEELAAIKSAFETRNGWSDFLKEVTTPEEVARVERLAHEVASTPEDADEFVVAFYRQAREALAEQPKDVTEFFERLPLDWHRRYGVYYTYPNGLKYGAAPDEPATLFDLARAQELDDTPYILYVTPFWKGPGEGGLGVDGGFDIVEYTVADAYGGEPALRALLEATRKRDTPMVVDIVANHLSDQTAWMQALRAGDESMADRFVQVPQDWKKVDETLINGRTYAVYVDGQGEETKRWIIFPHDARDHIIDVPIGDTGKTARLYHTFYRSQVDVNHRNPEVFEHFLEIQADIINRGVAGLRFDAAQHVMKADGSISEGLPSTFSWLELNNRFIKLISNGRAKTFPEIGAGTKESMPYLGQTTTLKLGGQVPAISDGFWMFQSRSRLPETVVSRDSRPFWGLVDEIPESIPANSTFMSMNMHHDELPAEFMMFPKDNLPTLLSRGIEFRDGGGVSGRMYQMVDGDTRQLELMTALKTVGIPNGTPVLYYGEEGKLLNDVEHAQREAVARERLLREQGTEVNNPFDSRDIHRQRSVNFEDVRNVSREYGPSRIYDDLLELRKQRPSLRSASRPIRLETGDNEVIAMIRYTGSKTDSPMLFVSNLGNDPKTIRIPRVKLRGGVVTAGYVLDDAGSFQTVLSNSRESGVSYRMTDTHLEITLEREAFTIADIPLRGVDR